MRPVRRGPAAILALLLCGCSSSGGSDYASYYALLRQGFSQSFGSGAISRQEAAAIPYASMGVRLDDGPESLLVLGSDTNGDQLWTSKAKIVVMTHDGRILRTVGLEHDLTALAPQTGTALPAPGAALTGSRAFILRADFADMGLYNTAVTCRMAAQRRETITILGRGLNTMRIDEACRADTMSWRFTNSYWVDAQSGFVWRSVQHLHPKGGIARTEIFRPAE